VLCLYLYKCLVYIAGFAWYALAMFKTLIAAFLVLSTLFMLFLSWLAQGSKDKLARNLRVFGWTATIAGWATYLLSVLHQIPLNFDDLP